MPGRSCNCPFISAVMKLNLRHIRKWVLKRDARSQPMQSLTTSENFGASSEQSSIVLSSPLLPLLPPVQRSVSLATKKSITTAFSLANGIRKCVIFFCWCLLSLGNKPELRTHHSAKMEIDLHYFYLKFKYLWSL